MKEQEYKKHIIGMKLDKLQEGDFVYTRTNEENTLSEFARKLREEIEKEKNNGKRTRKQG